jgi:hypothetical protein
MIQLEIQYKDTYSLIHLFSYSLILFSLCYLRNLREPYFNVLKLCVSWRTLWLKILF